jgi:hypothetical protein
MQLKACTHSTHWVWVNAHSRLTPGSPTKLYVICRSWGLILQLDHGVSVEVCVTWVLWIAARAEQCRARWASAALYFFLLHALHHQPEQFHSRGWRAFYWLKLCASGRLEWFQFKVVEILIAEPEQQGAVRRRCFNTKAPEISWFRQRAREQKMQRSGRTRRGGAAEIWPSRSRRIPRNYFSLREMKRIERNNYIKSRS